MLQTAESPLLAGAWMPMDGSWGPQAKREGVGGALGAAWPSLCSLGCCPPRQLFTHGGNLSLAALPSAAALVSYRVVLFCFPVVP